MKINVIGINYEPEVVGIAVYTSSLVEYLDQAGHSVSVVTAKPNFPGWKVFQGWRFPGYRRRRIGQRLRVTYCPLYVPKLPTGKKRLLHYASFALTALPIVLWQSMRRRPDIVFVVAPSMISAVVGWLAARLSGAKLWLHIQDFEVEAAFAVNLIAPESRLGRGAVAFERWMLARCDRVSTISAPMLAKLAEKGVPSDRQFELRNWANLDRIQARNDCGPLKADLGIARPLVVLYSGSIAAKQGLEIIPAAARLLERRQDVMFVVIGEGPFLPELKRLSEGLGNIRFLPLQPLDRLSDALAMADIHVLPQIPGVADLVLPSKLTNMLASGRPVIATALPDTALAQEVDGAGMITQPGDTEEFASAIETLLDAPDERRRLGISARKMAIQRWDINVILSRMMSEFVILSDKDDQAAGPSVSAHANVDLQPSLHEKND